MRLRKVRPDPGLLIAGISALILLPLMFRPWFCVSPHAPAVEGAITVAADRCFNAWTSFGAIDLVLGLTALVAIAITVMVLIRVRLPLLPGPLLTVLGGFSLFLVLMRLVVPPWPGASRASGPFLAVLCLAGVTAGGLLSNRIQAMRRGSADGARTGKRPSGPGGIRAGSRRSTTGPGRPRPKGGRS